MKIKRSAGERVFEVINILIMILLMFITLYPFLHVLFASFSESNALMAHRGLLWKPVGFNTRAYEMVTKNPNIYTGFRSTLILVFGGTAFNIIMTANGAFLLSRKDWAFRKFLMIMVLITMYISGGMVPTYLLIYETLNMKDSLWAIILPGAITTHNLIVLRTNFESIPDSLEEAAKIDGANDLVVLTRIILPLSKAAIAVMVLFYGVARWNGWFNAMLYLRSRDKFPLQLILREILISNSTDSMESYGDSFSGVSESIKYATIIVATVPILVVYPFIQKYFVKGTMVGAVKG